MTRPRVKEQEFVGKAAYLAQRAAPPAAVLCTLTVDDHTSGDGDLRYMLGGEPVLTDGRAADRLTRPPLLRDQRGLGAVGRPAHPDGLPAARAGGGGHAADRRVHGRSVSGDGSGGGRRRRCSIPPTSGSGA